jgi:hypothetical protein
MNFPIEAGGGGISLAGDARFDSPGFSAKLSSYFMQVIIII